MSSVNICDSGSHAIIKNLNFIQTYITIRFLKKTNKRNKTKQIQGIIVFANVNTDTKYSGGRSRSSFDELFWSFSSIFLVIQNESAMPFTKHSSQENGFGLGVCENEGIQRIVKS